ncbi:MAG: endonuclease [Pseudotabrizicola sp.]|uniref:endonuclease/exonuclease/phosphatase family protein n=1 Tax=Pseudotabrizicola sp. TaxID=2939647 RepID=UPI00271FA116|nr:endonuclease/exonuclease/phosphatase family protein [Pseudotabrizicola sp.]MDO8882272.1 endonuclease [Pseudotabrizicola sp.]MDP2080563.1 endonuclease [Pseudotabrizicola sp.]MDZ7573291.1 endonuclease [Pseudotabrizicola sp.]
MSAPERLRIATYNVEWFNALFDDDGRLLADATLSARYQTSRAEQAGALGIVFSAMDADAIMVIEAPDTGSKRSSVRALETFAQTFGIRANKAITGFMSETEQEITLLYDAARLTPRHDPIGDPVGKKGSRDAPRFDGTFRYDLNSDAAPELIRFSKPPLELAVATAGGRQFRMIGVHAKSKAPHGARTPEEITRLSIENRRKQLAECIWLRARVEDHLSMGDDLLVMGDFNDGPGLDTFEALFGHSGVEIVLGVDVPPEARMYDPHAAMAQGGRMNLTPTTARFWLNPQKRYFEALLDFIMVSPGLATLHPAWRIWHPWNDPACLKTPELHEALLQASDHFPVTIDLTLP